ncbi:hypothetical protein BGZ83_010186 [Gryganskiella cystojenkinii]|nr:hypothetical protein BGZ83_010186 [Gryganskiella cystojenkinii]
MKSTTLFVSLLLASTTALLRPIHGFVYPETPVGATVWKPNTDVTISWSDDKTPPLLSTKPVFDIFLMTGADDHQKKLATIATNVKAGPGGVSSVKYRVPNVSPPGQIYFLMFQTKDTKTTAWATRFTITDSAGDPGTLRPVIPAGGKINPGGNGSIVSTPVKFSPAMVAAAGIVQAASVSVPDDAPATAAAAAAAGPFRQQPAAQGQEDEGGDDVSTASTKTSSSSKINITTVSSAVLVLALGLAQALVA